jgi:hypothetical protein
MRISPLATWLGGYRLSERQRRKRLDLKMDRWLQAGDEAV